MPMPATGNTNTPLQDAFAHSTWATARLLTFCRQLSPEQLAASSTGSFGGTLDTFNHIIRADAGYLRVLTGHHMSWLDDQPSEDLDQLTSWLEETSRHWQEFLTQPFDPERTCLVNRKTMDVRAGVVLAQVLHHPNSHREHICANITGLGLQPPDVQPWEYAMETGRMWELDPPAEE